MAGSLDSSDLCNGMPTLGLRHTAPDAIGLPDRHRVVLALQDNRAHLADRFRTNLPALSLVLALLGTRWKEKVGMVSTTQCCWLPGTIWGHRGSLPLLGVDTRGSRV
jgi:hypothetical protein